MRSACSNRNIRAKALLAPIARQPFTAYVGTSVVVPRAKSSFFAEWQMLRIAVHLAAASKPQGGLSPHRTY